MVDLAIVRWPPRVVSGQVVKYGKPGYSSMAAEGSFLNEPMI